MPRFQLRLLGSFQAELDGRPLTGFRSDKVRALLAYLAVEARQTHRRDSLATLLWSEYDSTKANTSLRSALANLNSLLQGLTGSSDQKLLTTTRHTAFFDAHDPACWVDVLAFDGLLASCETHRHHDLLHCGECIERLKQATRLYHGEFLAGLVLPESYAFEEWQLLQAETRQKGMLYALRILTEHMTARGDFVHATTYARQHLTLLPWSEQAHRQLMRLYVAQNQRTNALAQYATCREILAEELGVEPEAETNALYEQIRSGELTAQTILLQNSPALAENPYKGLHAFREDDAIDFFGRDDYVRALLDAVHRQPFVAVVGGSGSGKTSVVRAGLIPMLRKQAQATPADEATGSRHDWLIADLSLSSDPFVALAFALLPWLEPQQRPKSSRAQGSAEMVAAALQSGQIAFADLVQQCLQQARQRVRKCVRMVLVIDEFEKLFALCPDSALRQHFLQTILAADAAQLRGADEKCPAFTLLITLRADYMGQALAYRPLADNLQEGTLLLGPVTPANLERIVTEPAARQGVHFQEGLAHRILEDVESASANLPLLEFALAQLWSQQRDGLLTHDAYESIGRVHGALVNYAEDTYAALDPAERDQARIVLLQMVMPGQGTEHVVHPALRSDIPDELLPIVQRLSDARLIVGGRHTDGTETFEIVHEALVREWSRLREWIDQDSNFRLWQERVRMARRQWIRDGRNAGWLLHGAALEEAEAWAVARPDELSPLTREFLAASRHLTDQEQLQELTRARSLLHVQEQLSDALARARSAARRAASQARRALAFHLSAQSIANMTWQPDLALLLSLEAHRLSETPEDRANLLLNLQVDPYLEAFLHESNGQISTIAYSVDGRLLAAGTADGRLILWDTTTRRLVTSRALPEQGELSALAFSPDGKTLATAGVDHLVRFSEIPTLSACTTHLAGHTSTITRLAFSADGKAILSVGLDHAAIRWDLTTGSQISQAMGYRQCSAAALTACGSIAAFSDGCDIQLWDVQAGEALGPPLKGHRGSIHALVFSPDGAILASCSMDRSVWLWDVANRKPLYAPLVGHSGHVLAAAFRRDGALLATGSADSTIRLWDLRTGKAVGSALAGHVQWILALDFSPDGDMLASASADGPVILWNVSRRRSSIGHTDQVTQLAFDPSGQRLASSSIDRSVRVWDAGHQMELWRLPDESDGVVRGLAFSPDGALLATAGTDHMVRLWNVADHTLDGAPLIGHTATVTCVTFSPDGRWLASGGSDRSTRVWDVNRGQPATDPMTWHTGEVNALAFSPDGTILASGASDRSIALSSVRTGQILGNPLIGHAGRVTSVSFSADGTVLASGDSNGVIMLWRLDDRQQINSFLIGHPSQVRSLAFARLDSAPLLISGSSDGAIILWDLLAGEPLGPPLFTHTELAAFALAPDAKTMAVAGSDGTIYLWDIQREPWQQRARAIANRKLSEQEWQHYVGDTQALLTTQ